MQQASGLISGVPTNIITGFLGVGKTSTLMQLLKNKPKDETWAVLVNEFGEIGIDGALLEGQPSEQNGVFVREVPGGCMCCTAGLPMRVALAQLLRQAKPTRLLIEPTGLGHPKEVLQTLNDADFRGVLAVQNIITLVDARHLSDERYAEHETFQQQIAIADVIVANKQDLYSENDKAALNAYLNQHFPAGKTLVCTEQGVIEPSLLTAASGSDDTATLTGDEVVSKANQQTYQGLEQAKPELVHSGIETPLPECGYLKASNKGEGFVSVGWRFSSRFVFDRTQLFAFLSGIDAERLKATFITEEGCFAYNYARDALTENSFEQFDQSRIEIIADQLSDDWEQALFGCLSNQSSSILINQ